MVVFLIKTCQGQSHLNNVKTKPCMSMRKISLIVGQLSSIIPKTRGLNDKSVKFGTLIAKDSPKNDIDHIVSYMYLPLWSLYMNDTNTFQDGCYFSRWPP